MPRRRKRGVHAPFDRATAWRSIKTTLARNAWTPHPDDGHAKLLLPGYAALTSLENGCLDGDGFITLNMMNATAFCLVNRCAAVGTAEVKRAMPELMATVISAAEVLSELGHRYGEVTQFLASGTQLQIIREAVRTLDRLAQGCPIALLVKALEDAQAMVDDYLSETPA